MIGRRGLGKAMIAVGITALTVSLAGGVVGWRLLTELEVALGRSLVVTSEAVAALDASVAVAEESIVLLERGLLQTERTTRDLARSVEDGEELFASTADLTEHQIADSLASMEETLPGLAQAAGVIDRTLSALSGLPFGPDYAPDEPFDASVRRLHGDLEGLPDDLRAQAALIRETGENLRDVRDGTSAIADELGALQTALGDASDLLSEYRDTASRASELVADSEESVGTQLRIARVMLVLLALSVAAGQVVPLSAGWFLLDPERGRAFLRRE